VLGEHAPHIKFVDDGYESSNRIIAALSQAVVVTEFYKDSETTLDLLNCCSQIGKLAFVMIDPKHGALTDEEGLRKASSYGAIPMVGLEKVQDIIDALV
jgi:predicted Rossmann fold nucleotide-binding protein DprA/Smf involved in DNA uptake